MGTYMEIKIENYCLAWDKNSIVNLLYFFSPRDLIIEKVKENEMEKNIYKLVTTVKNAKEVLDATGHTISLAEEHFNYLKEKIDFENKDYWKSVFGEINDENLGIKLKENFNFCEWKSAIKIAVQSLIKNGCSMNYNLNYNKIDGMDEKNLLHILIMKSLTTYVFSDQFYMGIPIEYIYSYMDITRVILETISEDVEIQLDYTDLVDSGDVDERIPEEYFSINKTIILTEGKYDENVLKESIKLLFPHLYKCFSFISFSKYKVQGSADFLPHYIKVFAGTGISNKIIGLFDNDTAGICAKKTLDGIKLPSNIKITNLPNIKLAEKIHVIDENNKVSIQNVNGIACSIELYLGKDVLKDRNGNFERVKLTDFRNEIRQYQGAILNKNNIHKRFKSKIKDANKNGISDKSNWKELVELIEYLKDMWK